MDIQKQTQGDRAGEHSVHGFAIEDLAAVINALTDKIPGVDDGAAETLLLEADGDVSGLCKIIDTTSIPGRVDKPVAWLISKVRRHYQDRLNEANQLAKSAVVHERRNGVPENGCR
jgi:hypothetical protein